MTLPSSGSLTFTEICAEMGQNPDSVSSITDLNSQWGNGTTLSDYYGRTWNHSSNANATTSNQTITSGNSGNIGFYLTFTQVQTGRNPTTGQIIYAYYVNLVINDGGALHLLLSFSWSYSYNGATITGSSSPNGGYSSGSATNLGGGTQSGSPGVSSVSVTFNFNHD
jgi:hypothetical protein